MSNTLVEITNELAGVIAQVDDYLDRDEEPPKELVERLNGFLTTQADKIDRCAAFVGRSKKEIEWLKDEKKQIDMAIKRFERGVKRMSDIAAMVMDKEDIRKLDGSKGHYFAYRQNVSVDIHDESLIPEDYWVVKKTPDKSRLMTDLKNGKEIPGARLVEGRTVIVK